MWTSAAGDEELGYVYVPLGNSAVDYYGGNRKDCENEFSSSLVAIDVTTGKPVWHFQTVHYDLWDYDLGSQPTLVDFPTDDGTVPAVILPSKQGEIYVLDRRTGKPLFPVEERKVPSGGVEPEQPFARPSPSPATTRWPSDRLTEKDMWGMSPLDQLWCRIQFRRATYKGEYTPPTDDAHYIEYPGYNGGSDWGSVAVDPEKRHPGRQLQRHGELQPPAARARRRDKRGLHAECNRAGAARTTTRRPVRPMPSRSMPAGGMPFTGLMCKQPPYGGIRAIDLATGKTLWDKPLGEARRERAVRDPLDAADQDRHAEQRRRAASPRAA